jgi:nicotinamide mononucleotide adenylyltransferase
MKFREFITENKEKHAVMAFGRMNPPTTGHEVLVNKVKSVAKQVGGSHHIILSHSQDAAKNPLTAAQKVKHAKRFFPDTNISVATKEEPNFLTQAAKLHKQGVTHLHMVAGADRTAEYHKLLHKYNGTHEGALFNFKKITVHNAGERDPDAEGTEGMSASKMRKHAGSGNFDDFKQGIPKHVPEHHAKELFRDVRKGMSIKESIDLNEEFEILLEGVHDQSIFKAIFLAGGPGSGKDYVLDNTLDGQGLT